MNANSEALQLDDFDVGTTATSQPPQREWLKRLPGLLRGFGAAIVLFSLYNFFARGWEGSSDLVRYLMLLGHTGALAGIGLASGHFLREGKGARLLLTLALVSVVANVAILGAFIVSGMYGGQAGDFPTYLTWSVGSLTTALLTTVGSLALLLPVVRIGFMTLARGISGRMTWLFLLGNAALLMPVRTSAVVTGLAVALALMLFIGCDKSLRNSTEVKTREGMIAVALLFIPVGVLLGRNIWLYHFTGPIFVVAVLTGFIVLRQLTLFLDERNLLRRLSNVVSLMLAAMAGIGVFGTLWDAGHDESLALIGATLSTAAMVYEIGLRGSGRGGIYRSIATVIAVLGLSLNLIVGGGLLSALLTTAVGIGLISASYVAQNRSVFIGGVLLALAGMIEQALSAFRLFDLGSWAALAVVGVVAILAGSLLESRGGQLKSRLQAWRSRYSEWTY